MQVKTHPISPEELMAYLDGESAAEQGDVVGLHLEICKRCQDVAADLQSVDRRLGEWGVEDGLDILPLKVSGALDERLAVRKTARGWLFPKLIVGLVPVAALVLLVFAFRPHAMQRKDLSPLAPMFNRAGIGTQGSAAVPSRLDFVRAEEGKSKREATSAEPSALTAGSMTIRTAELNLTAANFDATRTDTEVILNRFGGQMAELNVSSPAGAARSFTATLRIPAGRLDAALIELRKLGHVDGESQRGEEVTSRYVDIEARLTNSRRTEARLTEILQTRTGKLSEVLEVEEQLDKVRSEIERTEAQQKALTNRIALASVQLRVSEIYRPSLVGNDESSGWMQVRNATVTGLKRAGQGIMGGALWLLEFGPSLLLFAMILFFPARFLWRRIRWL